MGMGNCLRKYICLFVCYGVLDWAPVYLSEEKHFDLKASGWAYFLYEWAGIPGTLLCGYISDKLFKVAVDLQVSSLC